MALDRIRHFFWVSPVSLIKPSLIPSLMNLSSHRLKAIYWLRPKLALLVILLHQLRIRDYIEGHLTFTLRGGGVLWAGI